MCRKEPLDAHTNPLMYQFARQVAFEISMEESCTWLKHNPAQAQPVFCWWVSILDQFTCLCTGFIKNPCHVLMIGEGRLFQLPTGSHKEACVSPRSPWASTAG